MVDTITIGNDNDDWEVAVDTGEFDKRFEQQEKDHVTTHESISNKPIRILKRPTSQSKLPVINDIINSNMIKTIPIISIIPRNQIKDSINSLQITNSFIPSSSQSIKSNIKTYEQRQLEYRLARLRIMGEEESSTKDNDTDNPTIESNTITSDESTKIISSSITTPTSTKTSQLSLQNHSTLNNTGTIHFTSNTNCTGPFSQQQYHNPYSVPYSQIPFASPLDYPTAATLYMSSTVPSSNTWYHYQQHGYPQ